MPCPSPLKCAPEPSLLDAMAKPRAKPHRYEKVAFIAAEGTRAYYKAAAQAAGAAEWDDWMRAVLHKEATRVLKRHGVAIEAPLVQPPPPPPLMPSRKRGIE